MAINRSAREYLERKSRRVHIPAHVVRFPRLHLPYHQEPLSQTTANGVAAWYTWGEDTPESRFLTNDGLPS
jgi:hypothetical protein